MEFSKVEALTSKVPKLETAEELSARVRVPAERIMELAESGFMPHWRVDGGPPVFERNECKQWVDENLTTRCGGMKLPAAVCIVSDDPLRRDDLPMAIQRLANLEDVTFAKDRRTGVYFLCYGDKVVYVGQTMSVFLRMREHSDSEKEFDRAIFMPWPRYDLDRLERALIRALKPKYNLSPGRGRNIPEVERKLLSTLGLEYKDRLGIEQNYDTKTDANFPIVSPEIQ